MSERREKFTPGPFVVYPVSVNSESCDIVRQDDPNDRIAVTCEQSLHDGRELANGYLLASAPELYEALSHIVACLGAGEPVLPLCHWHQVATNAIAKARGEA